MKLEQVLSGTGFEGLGEAVADALREHTAQVAQVKGKLILGALQTADRTQTELVQKVRTLRKQADTQVKRLKDLTRANEYLRKTGNPLPFYKLSGNVHAVHMFCQQLGAEIPADDDPLWSVPDDFKVDG